MQIKITLTIYRKYSEYAYDKYLQDFNYQTSLKDIKNTHNFKWMMDSVTLFDRIKIKCDLKSEFGDYMQFSKTVSFCYSPNMGQIDFENNLSQVILSTCLEIYNEYDITKQKIKSKGSVYNENWC